MIEQHLKLILANIAEEWQDRYPNNKAVMDIASKLCELDIDEFFRPRPRRTKKLVGRKL